MHPLTNNMGNGAKLPRQLGSVGYFSQNAGSTPPDPPVATSSITDVPKMYGLISTKKTSYTKSRDSTIVVTMTVLTRMRPRTTTHRHTPMTFCRIQ